jgi:septal ring factor EnvC (AmiA/AmiB activator)
MKKAFALPIIGLAMMAATLVGCSNKPSDEELKQLEDLKAQVTSLEKEIASKAAEKDALLKAIAEKDAKLAQCTKDKDAVQAKLGAK